LHDAGALQKSHVGIAVTENTGFFSPACDVIMEGSVLGKLKQFFNFSKRSKRVIIIGFFISLIYNIVGLSFAVQALLSPVIAAILMPISSFSVVLWAVIGTSLAEKSELKTDN
jgi:P-type Cu+ transporter